MNKCQECTHRTDCTLNGGCEAFELDLEKHDKQIKNDAIAEYKENILEQLISYDDYCGYVYMPDIREMLDDAEIEVKGA